MQTRKTMATANNSHFTILQNKQSSTSHLATIRHCFKKRKILQSSSGLLKAEDLVVMVLYPDLALSISASKSIPSVKFIREKPAIITFFFYNLN